MNGSSLCPRILLGFCFAADYLHCLGTRGYLARDVRVRQEHQSYYGMNANDILEENAKMTDCYYETKDWRACKKEVRHPSLLLSFDLDLILNFTKDRS
jgi:hypothetical protein